MIHAGVYYTPGSLKAQFCLAGNRATKAFASRTASAMTSAANAGRHLAAGDGADARPVGSHRRQRPAARVAKRRELREREPNITGLGGIFVPSSGIVSYREVAAAMAKNFEAKGGTIVHNAEVSALKEHASGVVIRTRRAENMRPRR